MGMKSHLLWQEYGIELHFPSTSTVHIEGTVSVLSIDDDNYKFPEGSELVSAVYDISTNKPFPEPVTVKIQHCVPLDSEQEASAMSFVIADTSQGPPYKFHPLDGGIFSCGSSYAEIQLTHFSMPAIIRWCRWWLGRPIPFSASVYYLDQNMASLVVTNNLQAQITVSMVYCNSCYIVYYKDHWISLHMQAVKDSYSFALRSCDFPVMIDRRSSGVELEFPSDSTWDIFSIILPPKVSDFFCIFL